VPRDGWPLRGGRQPRGALRTELCPVRAALQQAAGWTVSGQLDDVPARAVTRWCWCCRRAGGRSPCAVRRALALVAEGGRIVACQSNNEGARSGEGDLKQLAGLGGCLTKNHCRVYWTAPLRGQHDADLAKRWSALDGAPIMGGRFLSRPGVFAWTRRSGASALLAEHLPADLAGAADLGAGGYLSRSCWNLPEDRAGPVRGRAACAGAGRTEPGAAAARCRCVSCGVTSPPASSRATTSSSATRRSTHRRVPTARTSASASLPWPRRRCAGGRLYVVANRHLPYEHTSTTASARCAWSPSATASSWLKR
jgi:16S rRNA (guanine1207-N2)-methyltransferase